jgi:hypothetical protein
MMMSLLMFEGVVVRMGMIVVMVMPRKEVEVIRLPGNAAK